MPYVALFRAINVGGRNALPMAVLKALLEDLGLLDVQTYIQSGNVTFRSPDTDAAALRQRIRDAIRRDRDIDPELLLLAPERLQAAIAGNPFPEAEADPSRLHVGFLERVPPSPNLTELEVLRKASERFALKGDLFYLHAPKGVGRSRLAANAERLLGVTMTDRNWRTLCRLAAMARV